MRYDKAIVALVGLACSFEVLHAQGVPDYGLTWRTIGDPGNPAAQPSDYYYLSRPVGRVDYQYRMTDTELTTTQWLDFLNAYCRANPNADINDPQMAGPWVRHSGSDATNPGWYAAPGTENVPVEVSWFYAARYVNWLNNGKAETHSAFETGAYDLSSFVQHPDGTWTGQTTRAPGSLFWLPSLDEWDKGMHWDPNKNGPGQGGYWLYPNSQDTAPVGGLPGTPGAQTNAYGSCPLLFMPVRSYPDQQSPWGLLDGSGGANEFLDGWHNFSWRRGSCIGSDSDITDRLDYIVADWPVFNYGIRIASAVPAPGSIAPAAILALALLRRKRNV
jgi:hypothetical protein